MIKSNSSNKTLRFIAPGIYILYTLFMVAVRFLSRILVLKELVQNNLILYRVVSLSSLVFMLFVEKVVRLVKKENIDLIKDKMFIKINLSNLKNDSYYY